MKKKQEPQFSENPSPGGNGTQGMLILREPAKEGRLRLRPVRHKRLQSYIRDQAVQGDTLDKLGNKGILSEGKRPGRAIGKKKVSKRRQVLREKKKIPFTEQPRLVFRRGKSRHRGGKHRRASRKKRVRLVGINNNKTEEGKHPKAGGAGTRPMDLGREKGLVGTGRQAFEQETLLQLQGFAKTCEIQNKVATCGPGEKEKSCASERRI